RTVDVHPRKSRRSVVAQTIKARLARSNQKIAIRCQPCFRQSHTTRSIDRGWRLLLALEDRKSLPQPIPRVLFVRTRITDHLMNERQVQRRQRQIVPTRSQRRREQEHASLAGSAFEQRGTAIFKARQHRGVRLRLRTEVTDYICAREPSARLKHLENRMIEFHFGDGDALAGLRLHRLTQRRRQDLLKRRVESVCLGSWTSRHNHLSAIVYKPHERVCQCWRNRPAV